MAEVRPSFSTAKDAGRKTTRSVQAGQQLNAFASFALFVVYPAGSSAELY